MLRSLAMLLTIGSTLAFTAPKLVEGAQCCGDQCSSDSDCAAGLFCCPNHLECMDTTTKSTIGPNCDACNPPSSPTLAEKECDIPKVWVPRSVRVRESTKPVGAALQCSNSGPTFISPCSCNDGQEYSCGGWGQTGGGEMPVKSACMSADASACYPVDENTGKCADGQFFCGMSACAETDPFQTVGCPDGKTCQAAHSNDFFGVGLCLTKPA